MFKANPLGYFKYNDSQSREMNISVSEFVEEAIRREYHKMVKKGTITDVPGQMSLDDFQ